MTRAFVLILATAAAAVVVATAAAITNGVPDGSAHPYVAIVGSGDWFCSGTLLSPTVLLTAGHCTDAFASTGEPTYVTADPDASPSSVYVTGTPHTQPGFFNIPPQSVGLPASVGHDLGIVVLDSPIVVARYGRLPAAVGPSAVTLVGYGAQGWGQAPHGRVPFFTFQRTRADARIVNATDANSDEFVRVSTSPGQGQGGIGPGDSGGPALSGDVVVAVGSHVTNPSGSGTAYFTRLDSSAAQAFIRPFLGG